MDPVRLKPLNIYYINDYRQVLTVYIHAFPEVVRSWIRRNGFVKLIFKTSVQQPEFVYQFFVDNFPNELLLNLTAEEVQQYVSEILEVQDISNIEDVYRL
jgi:hypothetical protein